MQKRFIKITLLFVFLLMNHNSYALGTQNSNRLAFQGMLKLTSGSAVSDGNYNMRFKLRELSSSTLLWSKTVTSVSVAGGVFSYNLSGTDDTTNDLAATLSLPPVFPGTGATEVVIDVYVDFDNSGSYADAYLSIPIAAVPYSFSANLCYNVADNAITAAKILNATITPAKLAQSGATTGQAMVWNGANWAPATIVAGVSSVTGSGSVIVTAGSTPVVSIQDATAAQKGAMQAGTGLSATSGTVSVDFAASGTSSATKAARADDSRLSDARPPNGSAAGDVSGTYPSSLVVSKVQGIAVSSTAPTSGQVLEYNGTAWAPTTFAGAVGSINGDSAAAQTFSAATTGTDFGITTAGGVTTFALPDATSAHRGALTSADFSTFSGKQDALTSATNLVLGGVASTLQGGVLLKPYGTVAGNTGESRYYELAANGSTYVGFKAPDNIATTRIWTLPGVWGANGQVLSTDGSGNLAWVSSVGGNVSSVSGSGAIIITGTTTPTISIQDATAAQKGAMQVGTGLTATSGTVSIDFTASGTSSTTKAVRADDSRLSDSRSASGSAGGDLTGTYPNPTLAAIVTGGQYPKVTFNAKGLVTAGTSLVSADLPLSTSAQVGAIQATAGKVTVDGSGTITNIAADTAAVATTANAIKGTAVSATAPTSGQVLEYDGTTWSPATLVAGITALTSDVTASGVGSVAATVNSVGGSTAATIHAAELLANAATNASTASTLMKRTASGNSQVNAIDEAIASTATAAGSTTLTVASAPNQIFTGTTTQTVILPSGTTLVNGHKFNVVNLSTGVVTVKDGSSTLLQAVAGGSSMIFYLGDNTTVAGTWKNGFDLAFAGPLTNTNGSVTCAAANGSTAGCLSAADWTAFNSKQTTLVAADASHSGYLSTGDWVTFNAKQAALTIGNITDAGTDGITITGGTGAVIGTVSLSQHVADSSHPGYLASADWTSFNGMLTSKENVSNKVTVLTSPDDTKYPSAQAVVNAITAGSGLIEARGITVDGQGGVPTTGSKGYITFPYACTITKWYVTGDVSGSVQFDIKRSSASIIGGGNKPILSSAQNANAAPSSWTSVAIAAGDIIEFNLDSVATLSRVTLTLAVTR